jgi:hypothetical protein
MLNERMLQVLIVNCRLLIWPHSSGSRLILNQHCRFGRRLRLVPYSLISNQHSTTSNYSIINIRRPKVMAEIENMLNAKG